MVPRLHRYYEVLRLPAVPSAALRCLRLAVPPGARDSLRAATSASLRTTWTSWCGRPTPQFLSSGDDWISQVPCEPLITCPAPSTPTEDDRLDQSDGDRWCLPRLSQRRPPQPACISGLNHAAHDLAVYASQPRSPSGHATLATDWCGLTLVGRDLHPLGSNARFHGLIADSFPKSQGFPGAR